MGLVVVQELVGSSADECFIILKLSRIAHVSVDMLGKNGERAGYHIQERSIRMVQVDLHGIVVQRFSIFYGLGVDPLIGVLLDVVTREDHVIGGELLTVIPSDVFSQVEDVGIISHHLPALRQGGHVVALVLPYQSVEDEAHSDVAGTARVVTVGRRKSPVTCGIGDGEYIYRLIGCY